MSAVSLISAALMLATGLTHSILGERRLVVPILALNTGILRVPLVRQLVRFAWHFTSLLMAMTAAAVVWPGTPLALVRIIGAAWLATGLFDLVYTKGKHIGWPVITGAGITALLA